MNITNFCFEKKIKKIKNQFYIEIYLPLILNNISYKIYGNKNFIFTGKLKLYNENNINNILIIPINKIQNIFILITDNNKNEYFDFFNMNDYLDECVFKKNIKLTITKKNNDNIKNNEEDSDTKNADAEDAEDAEDSDSEDSNTKDSDSEDSDSEDSDAEDSDAEDSDTKDSDAEDAEDAEDSTQNIIEYNNL